MDFSEYLANAPSEQIGPVVKLAQKIIDIGEEIVFIEKDATNPHFGYKYPSEKAIKEEFYPKIRAKKILFWIETKGDKALFGGKDALVLPGVFHFLDAESGGHIWGDFAGSGRYDDKGVYIGTTGIIKYVLTTIGGIVTGDDAEADKTVIGTDTPTNQGSTRTTRARGAAQGTVRCGRCNQNSPLSGVKKFDSQYADKKGAWDVGDKIFLCPICLKNDEKSYDSVERGIERFKQSQEGPKEGDDHAPGM